MGIYATVRQVSELTQTRSLCTTVVRYTSNVLDFIFPLRKSSDESIYELAISTARDSDAYGTHQVSRRIQTLHFESISFSVP